VTPRWADIGLTATLVIGFAAVGETALRRRSRDLPAWNESFLAGMAVCAAALFPLSLWLPRSALRIELALLAGGLLVALLRRARRVPRAARSWPRGRWDPVQLALLTAVVLVAVEFTAVDLRYSLLWDGFQIWASKAQRLYYQGGLDRHWYSGDGYDFRLVAYPPLVPLGEALLQVVRGQFDFDSVKPVFLPLYYSMLIATYAAVRAVAPGRLAAAATLTLALLPLTSTYQAAGGYGDMPQAAFVAGTVGAAFRGRDSGDALPWLIGGLAMVKPEGTILAIVACLASGLVWRIERRPIRSVPWGRIAVVAGFLILRLGYLRWVGAVDTTYAVSRESLPVAVARFPHVARVCMVKMLSPRRWGLLWPAFGLAALVLARRGSPLERSLAIATAATAVLFAMIFLFTTWPLDLHIDQAYPRLLAQLSPAAVVAVFAGWSLAQPVS